MQTKSTLMTVLLLAAMTGTGALSAADMSDATKNPTTPSTAQRAAPDGGRHDGAAMHGGMMNGAGGMMRGNGGMMNGMSGMMGMMNGCSAMMGGAMTPHLPAGNEKLQLKMQAEIMQKTAEILAKYADQIGVDGKSTP